MPAWLPSVPYSAAQDGYWLPVTSTLNWCEEDYYATRYAAEIVNTLTNLLFMFLASKGIVNCLNNDHDTIFFVTFVGYLLVGIGSFLFHATLKYPWQLVDELSMIYTTCLMFYATFSYNQTPPIRSLLAAALVSLCLFITAYYHYLQEPTFHQVTYAVLTILLVFRSLYIMEANIRPSQRRKKEVHETLQRQDVVSDGQKREQQRQDDRDSKTLSTMWIMIGFGLSIFVGGFFIWTIDNVYCSTLRRWRRSIGLPWGVLLEGHGWWHLMTGLGAYFYITWAIWLRHYLNGKADQYKLVWPAVLYSLPVVVRTGSSNGAANGSAKKAL